MDEFFAKTLARIEAKTSNIPTALGCHEWQGGLKTNSNYGVIKIHPPGQNITTRSVHRIKYLCLIKNLNVDRGLDISHICHNPKCLTTEHLTLEAHEINMNRVACFNEKTCSGEHQPECLFL